MLLRIAIGWHFLYEGCEKVESTHKGGKPFSAGVYLRNATGPLAPYFRGLVPDVNSLAKLDPKRLKAGWAGEIEALANHYRFDEKQRSDARTVLKESEADADIWFEDRETTEKRRKYYHELREVQAIERNPAALSYQRERAAARRKDLDIDRKALLADLDARGAAMREAVTKLATAEQRKVSGPYSPPWTTLDWVDFATMWGLIGMGVCLILGLLSRLAALAGAVFLVQIYMSMPPWPGLPPNPLAEGHYLIVNKNLIEMVACLALASLPTSAWIGLDALLFGARRRRRELAREAAPARETRQHAMAHETRVETPEDTGPIPY